MILPSKELFRTDILKPLEREVAIRYIEFPGESDPTVFVRIACITPVDGEMLFGCLTARLQMDMSTRPWNHGHVFSPYLNWEIAARLIGEGRIWEPAGRSWESTQYEKPGDREWLVQSLRADKAYIANPKFSEEPKFVPTDQDDKVRLQKLVALSHMIPCYLDTGLLHGSKHKATCQFIQKLQDRLNGYLRTMN